ncbi:MAG: hypothetical protein U9O56_07300 [Campylobacterota bacterium]|nr:hypothetical protein [Campylobacterota bacterium]
MFRNIVIICLLFIFTACSSKKPIYTNSSIVLFKAPQFKFYDKGFISKYNDHIHLQIFQVGQIALDLKVYKDEVCLSKIECLSSKQFNKEYLSSSYSDSFLYNLLSQEKIYFKDKKNNILIKVKNN